LTFWHPTLERRFVVFWIFSSFLKKYGLFFHNMLFFMLDHKFNGFPLDFSFIGHEQGVVVVEECDTKSLCFMSLKCHLHLHPLIEFENNIVDYRMDQDCNLDIFEIIARRNELTKEYVK